MVWSPFAVSTVKEAEKFLHVSSNVVKNACVDKAEPDVFWNLRCFQSHQNHVPEDCIYCRKDMKAPPAGVGGCDVCQG